MLTKGLKRSRRTLLGRVEEGNVPSENKVPLVLFPTDLFARKVLGRHCQHTETIVAEALVFCLQTDDQGRIHCGQLPVQFKLRALMKNFLRGALGQEDRFAFRVLHHDRHHASGEVEGNLIQLLVLLDQRLTMEIGTIQDCPVEQVLEAGLEITDQVTGPIAHPQIHLPRRCNDAGGRLDPR